MKQIKYLKKIDFTIFIYPTMALSTYITCRVTAQPLEVLVAFLFIGLLIWWAFCIEVLNPYRDRKLGLYDTSIEEEAAAPPIPTSFEKTKEKLTTLRPRRDQSTIENHFEAAM